MHDHHYEQTINSRLLCNIFLIYFLSDEKYPLIEAIIKFSNNLADARWPRRERERHSSALRRRFAV